SELVSSPSVPPYMPNPLRANASRAASGTRLLRGVPWRSGSSKRTHSIPASVHSCRLAFGRSAILILLEPRARKAGQHGVVFSGTLLLAGAGPNHRPAASRCQSRRLDRQPAQLYNPGRSRNIVLYRTTHAAELGRILQAGSCR